MPSYQPLHILGGMGAHFLTPVTRTTLTADVCKKLVGHLVRGDWEEGEKIPPERELCRQLGVGRASLREALKAIEMMGMIETRLGEGTFVCSRTAFLSRPLLWAIAGSSKEEIEELIEARRLMEVELAGLAAERGSLDDLAKIHSFLQQMENAADDLDRFQDADISFHIAIGLASHNRILSNALMLTRNLLLQWIGSASRRSGVPQLAIDQHREIYQALERRDAAGARGAMTVHLEAMASHFRAVMREQNAAARPELV